MDALPLKVHPPEVGSGTDEGGGGGGVAAEITEALCEAPGALNGPCNPALAGLVTEPA